MINFLKSLFIPKSDKGTIHFGNLTGSGMPLDYVNAHPEQFPLSSYSYGFKTGKKHARGGLGGCGGEVVKHVTINLAKNTPHAE